MVRITFRSAGLLGLLLLLNISFIAWPRVRYGSIVVHHTASDHGDYQTVRRAHHARGWAEIAYHAVLSNGSTDVPFGHLYPTWRYRLGLWSVATRSLRFNVRALHLCVVGNFEQSAPSARMQGALGHALSELIARHGISRSRIYLHRDCSATACPGRYIDRDKLALWLDHGQAATPEIKAQHRAALGRLGGRFRGSSLVFAAFWLTLNAALLLALVRHSRGG